MLLTSIIAALAAHRRPEDLVLWTIANSRNLPSQVQRLPHQACGFVDADDPAQLADVLQQVRGELIRRMQAAEHAREENQTLVATPDILLVIAEFEDLLDDGETLEWLGLYGPAHGVRLLAATTNPAAVSEETASYFGTRLVLQTLDDQESIRLLGRPDGADLGSGDVLVRVDGRSPVRAQGLRVSPEHLDELVRLMSEAYGAQPLPRSVLAGSMVASDGDAGYPSHEDHVAPDPKAAAMNGDNSDSEVIHLTVTNMERTLRQGLVEDSHPEDEPIVQPTEDGAHPLPDHGEEPADGLRLDALLHNGAPSQLMLDSMASADIQAGFGGDSPVADAPLEGQRMAGDLNADSVEEVAPSVGVGEPFGVGSVRQVRCFGEFEVRAGDREIKPSLEDRSVNRSFELLAFLCAQQGGSVSKDKVLAALWPDADEDRGTGSLHVTATRLRGALTRHAPGLSSSIVRSDRDGTCRLDTDLIWSDVHEFLALCRAASKLPADREKAALQRAVALYRGDLLGGTATRLYLWVDERGETGVSLRDLYREEFNRTVQRLARLLYLDGQAIQAVPLLRHLLRAEPTLEDVVRDLYRCYQQLGDISSLVREDRHLRQSLQEAYFDPDDPNDAPDRYQPEAETVELFNDIRSQMERRAAASSGESTA